MILFLKVISKKALEEGILIRHHHTHCVVEKPLHTETCNLTVNTDLKLPNIYLHIIRSINKEMLEELKLLAIDYGIITLTRIMVDNT